eukprot:Hpha_TRINITY_DN22860_c0_g1::TRINITY_DN22860_c0_g1_i1::g.84268::m.84268/K03524/birA; BirA family transcriptional regulator, biotin operon repressor / biotin-[acetyl-CoA-carboxylase] ligase
MRALATLSRHLSGPQAQRVGAAAAAADVPVLERDVGGRVRVHFEVADSTMAYARQLSARYGQHRDFFVVTAASQRSGRGTGERVWLCPPGNVYMTVAIRKELLGSRLAFLPLDVGLAVVHGVCRSLPGSVRSLDPAVGGKGPRGEADEALLSVKWPNDVLISGTKVSGNLIQDSGVHMIVGIGVNVKEAPVVKDRGRTAGSLAQFGAEPDSAFEVAGHIADCLINRVLQPRTNVVPEYSSLIDWSAPIFEREEKGSGPTGPKLKAVRLTEWGHLVVRNWDAEDAAERTLCAEYLH